MMESFAAFHLPVREVGQAHTGVHRRDAAHRGSAAISPGRTLGVYLARVVGAIYSDAKLMRVPVERPDATGIHRQTPLGQQFGYMLVRQRIT